MTLDLEELLSKEIQIERGLYDRCREEMLGGEREHAYCLNVLRNILACRGQASDAPRGAPPTAPASPSADELAEALAGLLYTIVIREEDAQITGPAMTRARALLARRRAP